MNKKINMFSPYINKSVIKNLDDVFHSGWIGQGQIVNDFENKISQLLNIPYVVATSTSSSAIRMALEIIGVTNGDQVITTPMTCTLTNHPIIETGADLVFADVQADTGNINPKDIIHKITPKTKAIICAHWGGYPCDVDEINKIAKEHNIRVIEDASEAFGATYKSKNVGTLSEFTALSFQAVQIITTAEGGALCVCDENSRKFAKNMSWYGIDREDRKPNLLGYYDFDIKHVGFGYHMTNLEAMVGIKNLDSFLEQKKHRKEVYNKYVDLLKNVPGVKLIKHKKDRESSNHFFTIHVENRNGFCIKLQENNIYPSIVHDRNDKYTVFGGKLRKDLLGLNDFYKTFICLPNHMGISIDDVIYICNIIKSGW